MSVTYLCCPKCQSALGLHRQGGGTDVPDSAIGKRRRTKIPTRITCEFCGHTFHSESATLWEVYGRDGTNWSGDS